VLESVRWSDDLKIDGKALIVAYDSEKRKVLGWRSLEDGGSQNLWNKGFGEKRS